MKHLMNIALAFSILLPLQSAAGEKHGHAPYAGFENRKIKSLSEEDMKELKSGAGWGLALPAELNGMPGPSHLLQLKTELELTPDQISKIEEIFTAMKSEAIAAGAQFIQAEAELSAAFETNSLNEETLGRLIAKSEEARSRLRYIHLSRHLSTPPLLTAGQIDKYKILRGYKDDPCAEAPEGHDREMWRKHNGCD